MNWKELIEDGKVKKTHIDEFKIKSLIEMSDSIIESFSKIEINEINSSIILSNYYESLRQIIEAITIKHSYNVYSHEAFTIFILEILNEDIMSEKFDRFRKLRNGVNYYGKKIEKEITIDAKEEIIKIIKYFKKNYL